MKISQPGRVHATMKRKHFWKIALVLITLGVVNCNVTRHGRHNNRLLQLYETHRKLFGKHQISELTKHAYDTSDKDVVKPISRFPKLDRMLNEFKWPRSTKPPPTTSVVDEQYFVHFDNRVPVDFSPSDGTSISPLIQEMDDNVLEQKAEEATTQVPLNATSKMTPTINYSSANVLPISKIKLPAGIQFKKKAHSHILNAKMETICRVPQPRVIHVQDVFPNPSKIYVPSCTVLHRCGHDTGCCDNEKLVCREKSVEMVDLYFLTHHPMENKQIEEKLQFINHTECECGARGKPTFKESQSDDSQSVNEQSLVINKNPPRCPSKFSVRLLPDGSFLCDCFDKQKDCLRLKKGKDLFPKEDQLCMRNFSCRVPLCEYGQYLPSNGRCVVKKEMFSYWPKYSIQQHSLT